MLASWTAKRVMGTLFAGADSGTCYTYYSGGSNPGAGADVECSSSVESSSSLLTGASMDSSAEE